MLKHINLKNIQHYQHINKLINYDFIYQRIKSLRKTSCIRHIIIRNPKKELQVKDNKTKIINNKILKEYGIGAQILIDLGAKKIKLLTSSSKNIVGIDGFGLEINGTKKL